MIKIYDLKNNKEKFSQWIKNNLKLNENQIKDIEKIINKNKISEKVVMI